MEKSLLSKLEETICNRIFEKIIDDPNSNKVHMSLCAGEIQFLDDKFIIDGIKIAGYIHFAGGSKQEMADVKYKMSYLGGAMIHQLIYNAIWIILMSRLKHFNIEKSQVIITEPIKIIKRKRFIHHTKKMITP